MVPTGPQPVPPALRPYVASMVGYDVDVGAPGVHRGLPGTALTFVLPLDAPLDVSWAGDPGSRRSDWSSVSGLHTAPATIHHDGHQRGLHLALTVAGARALLGMPAGALAGQLLDLTEATRALATLPERLHDQPTWAGRVATVWEQLGRVVARDPQRGENGVRPEVRAALGLLRAGTDVAGAAAEVGYSRRHLGALVRAETGLTPKVYQQVARFERARALVVRDVPAGRSLGEVAAAAGYADQAHLSREWLRFARCTPSTWMAEELSFVQDGPGPVRAG